MRVDSCTAWIFLKRARALSLSLPLSLSQIWLWRRNHRWRDWYLLYMRNHYISIHVISPTCSCTWKMDTPEAQQNTNGSSSSFISEAHDFHHLFYHLLARYAKHTFFITYLYYFTYCASDVTHLLLKLRSQPRIVI